MKYGFILNTYGIQSRTALRFKRTSNVYESVHPDFGGDDFPAAPEVPGWISDDGDTEMADEDIGKHYVGILYPTLAEAQRYRQGVNLLQDRLNDFLKGFVVDTTDPIALKGVEDYKRILTKIFTDNK